MAEWPESPAKPDRFDAEQSALIRRHLQDILSSSAFAGSKRAQEFLRLVVEHALADRTESLKERMIGVEMFGRPVDYDTANDAVVRVKATEVRRRLAQYYQDSAGRDASVRIDLPVGSYVPKFVWPDKSAPAPAALLSAAVDRPATHVGRLPAPDPSMHTRAAATQGSRRRWVLAAALVPLVAIALFLAFQGWSGISTASPIRSIAVLPLVNFSGDPKQDYFTDGMTEELIAELGQASSLRVISRTSVMTYKGTKKTVPVIARELHVDGILEGSIEREGNKVRIIVQLIDSRTDEHIGRTLTSAT